MRTSTWSNVGNEVSGKTVKEVLEQSGLNYKVSKEPIFLANGRQVPGKFATVADNATKDILGTVGEDYEIIQNEDAFNFMNGAVPAGLTFERAGQLYWGLVYAIASLPTYKLFGDEIKTYIICQHSHSGQALKAAILPLRILCQNQFAMAFKNIGNTVVIRHTKNAPPKMEEAKNLLQGVHDYTVNFRKSAEELAKIKIPVAVEERILAAAFPVDEKTGKAKEERMIEARTSVSKIFHDTDDLQNFKGTGYGLLNAYSDFVTHAEPARKTEHWEEAKFFKSMQTNDMDAFVNLIRKAS
jgi:phage/plasmid-like protein (TIGR03299 family)